MNKQIFRFTLLFFTFILLVFTATSCGSNTSSGGSTTDQTTVQIKEYNGKNLSSISDVRDVSIKGPQNVDINTYKLKIDGLVENPTDFTYDEVLKNEKQTKEVVLNCVEGWSADILWEGVFLSDLLDKVNVKPEANTVIFYSVDGYTTSLPLSTILDKKLILADKMNGVVLPAANGYPFILVAEDKLGYKWIKWINRIELSNDQNYKGYWETRGYSNEADVKN